MAASPAMFISTDALLAHWQAHRHLTRRLIKAFPEDQLFSFSVGSMRSFGVMVLELLSMAGPTVRGVATGTWSEVDERDEKPKAELLERWDDSTATIDEFWAQIPAERFQESQTAFGQWTMPVYDLILYVIDNEIHHRGQAYVYLRSLGVEPPAFYDRS